MRKTSETGSVVFVVVLKGMGGEWELGSLSLPITVDSDGRFQAPSVEDIVEAFRQFATDGDLNVGG
jgi:hypothetical protein